MATVEDMLKRATRLLAMALAAGERGDMEAAERLTAEASLCFDEATGLETPRPSPSPSPPRAETAQPVMQQQQQIQPENEDLKGARAQTGSSEHGASGGQAPDNKSGGDVPKSED